MQRWMYDLMYRVWAPWDAVGVRDDLRDLLDSGRVTPHSHPRAIDLGCGTGANAVYLAEHGFDGGRRRLLRRSPWPRRRPGPHEAGVECRFVAADLTADLSGAGRTVRPRPGLRHPGRPRSRAVAGRWRTTCARLTRPGSLFLFWCFYADPASLPRFSVTGPSRAVPVIRAGRGTRPVRRRLHHRGALPRRPDGLLPAHPPLTVTSAQSSTSSVDCAACAAAMNCGEVSGMEA